jgi:hypothetical protein
MSIDSAENEGSQNQALEEAKASLVLKFIQKVDSLPRFMVLEAMLLDDDAALAMIVEKRDKPPKPLSVKTRNELAFALMKDRAFVSVAAAYELIKSNDVCTILGITKQALSLKTKSGELLAYTKDRRKYFPAFQFHQNKVKPGVGNLVRALGIDTSDIPQVNMLIGWLATYMDYYGEPDEGVPRWTLLEEEGAFSIIIRDFKNRLEMGK